MDKTTRAAIEKAAQRARKLLKADFAEQLEDLTAPSPLSHATLQRDLKAWAFAGSPGARRVIRPIELVILRTGLSPPVAPHAASRLPVIPQKRKESVSSRTHITRPQPMILQNSAPRGASHRNLCSRISKPGALPRQSDILKLPMIGTIAITDEGWYHFLRDRPEVTELNFWTPSARRTFRAPKFSPFIFKLRAPYNAVCGFAYFAQFSRLPDWLAWDTFGLGNGCATFEEMHQRIARIRARIRYDQEAGSDEIGCIQLVAPTFFPPDQWIPQPSDWHPRSQTPVKYDLTVGEGRRVWDACLAQAVSVAKAERVEETPLVPGQPRYGPPRLIQPRLGQNTFRIAVLDAYNRGCAVTHEHSLPALEASHIRPFAQNGPHEVRNGLLLRADLHRLFDKGYVTVTPEYRLKVSFRLREDYHNGRTYYPLDDTELQMPVASSDWPDRECLEWHNEHVYRG